MTTPKKPSRRERNLAKLEDFENIVYTPEEAEYLGYGNSKEEEPEDDDDENYLDSEDDSEEDDEKPASKKTSKTSENKGEEKQKYYVTPQEFDDEITKYYETNHITDELANMISKIAHKLSYASNFINYTYREEMVGDGIIRMFKALISKKYSHNKGTNPFSYFTRIAFNAFRNRIKKEKHLREIHQKYQDELLLFSENYNTIVKNNQLRLQRERQQE